jgi:predicted nucleic acid-binding protein
MTGFLLDTNVPSELTRLRPAVVQWLDAQNSEQLFLSVVTLGEIRKGVTLLADSKRRSQLEQWFSEELLPWFVGRILPVTQAIADRWGVLDAASLPLRVTRQSYLSCAHRLTRRSSSPPLHRRSTPQRLRLANTLVLSQ